MHTRKTHPDKSKWNLIEGETETESNTHTQRAHTRKTYAQEDNVSKPAKETEIQIPGRQHHAYWKVQQLPLLFLRPQSFAVRAEGQGYWLRMPPEVNTGTSRPHVQPLRAERKVFVVSSSILGCSGNLMEESPYIMMYRFREQSSGYKG